MKPGSTMHHDNRTMTRFNATSNLEIPAMKPKSRHLLLFLALVLPALFVSGCSEDLQETDSGGIALSVEFVQFPGSVGVNDQDRVPISSMDINSIVLNPGSATSSLMDVEVSTMEVTFTRADTGTRVPVPYVVQLLGTVPVGGTLSYTGVSVLGVEQMRAEPLSDLLFENGGIDKETGNDYIRLNVNVRIYGRTRGGENVVSRFRGHTIEFVPSLVTSL